MVSVFTTHRAGRGDEKIEDQPKMKKTPNFIIKKDLKGARGKGLLFSSMMTAERMLELHV